jgi:hypothetical protein
VTAQHGSQATRRMGRRGQCRYGGVVAK